MKIENCQDYANRLKNVLSNMRWENLTVLYAEIESCIAQRRRFFVCGNGGSLGNAMHIANDLLYPLTKKKGEGLKVYALGGNPSTLSCIANDEGYEHIFSYELAVQAEAGDVLMVLSGSGNSPNVIEAVKTAKEMGVKTFGILGYDGGKLLNMVDVPIHINIDDMQISEDMQMVCFNIMIQQYLRSTQCMAQ